MAERNAYTDKFAPDARQALALAQAEADTYRQRLIGTEHLLLGLLRVDGIASQTLQSFGVTEPSMRDAVDLLAGRGTLRHAADRAELNVTQRTLETFELADRLSTAFGDREIRGEHLLLALLEIAGNAALGVLQALGIERPYLRDRTFTFMRQPNPLPDQTIAPQLTHLDQAGHARMVDVGAKDDTAREAIARGRIVMQPDTLRQIVAGGIGKGDVLATARIAGIMAAKQTSQLIPLCHPLMLTSVAVDLTPDDAENAIAIQATVRTTGKTGVEMEALTAVSVAALTIYDMCKAIDRAMRITDVRLAEKRGGKSGEIVLE